MGYSTIFTEASAACFELSYSSKPVASSSSSPLTHLSTIPLAVRIVDNSQDGGMTSDTKIGIVVAAVLFFSLILGFCLVARNKSRARSILPTRQAVQSPAQRKRKSPSVYSVQSGVYARSRIDTEAAVRPGDKATKAPSWTERHPAHLTPGRRSQASVSTLSVVSDTTYVGSTEYEAALPTFPSPCLHTSDTFRSPYQFDRAQAHS